MIVGNYSGAVNQAVYGSRGAYSDVYSDEDNNHVYYNVVMNQFSGGLLPPTPSTPMPAQFREERVQPIIKDMEDYYMSIVRFSIPTQNLPIFLYAPDTTASGNNDPYSSSQYSITLYYNGVFVRRYVSFNPSSIPTASNLINPPPPPFTAITPQTYQTFYTVNSVQQWLDSINLAIQSAYDDPALAAAPPQAAGDPAPFFMYDPETQLISLFANPLFTSLPYGSILNEQLFMNSNLFNFFRGSFQNTFIGYDTVNGNDYLITIANKGEDTRRQILPPTAIGPEWNSFVIYNTDTVVSQLKGGVFHNFYSLVNPNLGNSPATSPVQWQDMGAIFTPPAYWSATTAYVLGNIVDYLGAYWIATGATTGHPPGSNADWSPYTGYDMIEVEQEYSTLFSWNIFKQIAFVTGIIPSNYELTANLNNAGAQQFKAILTDFEPNETEGPEARSILQYFPQGPYRMINLNGKGPLNKSDLQVFWVDKMLNFYPILLGPSDILTVKIMFRKRTYTGS